MRNSSRSFELKLSQYPFSHGLPGSMYSVFALYPPATFEDCMRRAGVSEEEIAYMGDDLPDINLAKRAGFGVCVADGAPELKAVCTYITQRGCGKGAAREVIELILKAQGRWEEAVPLAHA